MTWMQSCLSFVLSRACHHFYSELTVEFVLLLARWLTLVSNLAIFLGRQGYHYLSCRYTWTLGRMSQRPTPFPLGIYSLFTHLQSLRTTSRTLWSVLAIWPWLSLQCRYSEISRVQIFQMELVLIHRLNKLQLESFHLKYVFCAARRHQR